MLPRTHFLLGIIFVAILYFFFYPVISIFGLTIILLSSVLIDIDHYIYYIFKKRDWNPFRAHKWYIKNIRKLYSLSKKQTKAFYLGLYFFHGIEILIILFLLGNYISQFFNFILIGFLFHLSMDFITEIIFEQRFDKISFIYNLLTFRKLKDLEESDFI